MYTALIWYFVHIITFIHLLSTLCTLMYTSVNVCSNAWHHHRFLLAYVCTIILLHIKYVHIYNTILQYCLIVCTYVQTLHISNLIGCKHCVDMYSTIECSLLWRSRKLAVQKLRLTHSERPVFLGVFRNADDQVMA